MNETEVTRLLRRMGAVIINSHIVYTSGRHGSTYVNKDAVYPHTEHTSQLCLAIAERFADDRVHVVAGPAVGGVILSQWVAFHLTGMTGREILAVYAEKAGEEIGSSGKGPSPAFEKRFTLGRGYDTLVRDKNVLVVEDIITTGGSVRGVVRTVRRAGGNVIGVGVLCNRGGVTAEDVGDVPKLSSLASLEFSSFDENSCPLCRGGIPINTDIGKGREFLEGKLRK